MQHVHLQLMLAWFLGWWFWLVPVLVGLCWSVAVSVALIVRLGAGAIQVWLPFVHLDHSLLCTVIDCCNVCSYFAVS